MDRCVVAALLRCARSLAARQNRGQDIGSRLNNWFPRLHRWLGLGALIFVLILSFTGIALNHSTQWSLDRRFIGSEWLLRVYGIDAPAPSASFEAGGHTVALLGERLYFDELELVAGVTQLVGAIATTSQVLIGTTSSLLLVASDGRLIEQVAVAGLLPGALDGLGRIGEAIALRAGPGLFVTDPDLLQIEPWQGGDESAVDWAVSMPLDPARLDGLQQLYRGRGLTLERLLLDLHSGRIAGSVGRLLLDAAGVALIALSMLGLALWLNRRPRRVKRHGA